MIRNLEWDAGEGVEISISLTCKGKGAICLCCDTADDLSPDIMCGVRLGMHVGELHAWVQHDTDFHISRNHRVLRKLYGSTRAHVWISRAHNL